MMLGQTNEDILEKGRQRALRRSMTDAEQAMWRVLRGRQVAGVKFRRQHPFGDYILDFVCLELRLIVEVDGGQHAERAERDAVRTAHLQEAGFWEMRFWNHEVLKEIEAMKEKIWGAVSLLPHPHPGPPLEGEG